MDIASEGPAWEALDADNPADPRTLASFLVNALYLFGGQAVAAPGVPAGVTAELTRLGHRIGGFPGGEAATGRGSGQRSPGRLDRVFLPENLGLADDPVGRLRALRRALRPGGLLCFHVVDRDRAWERTGPRPLRVGAEGGAFAEARVDFDPASGRLIARARDETAGTTRPAASVRTWNLAEVKGLLQATGWELERAYGDWEGGAPGGSAGRLIVVAAKPRGARRARYSPSSASASASTSSGSSSATRAATLSTRSWGEKGLARKSAKASPTSSTTPSVAP